VSIITPSVLGKPIVIKGTHMKAPKQGGLAGLAITLALVWGGGASATQLTPRTPQEKRPVTVSSLAASDYQLTVKFVDGDAVRTSTANSVTSSAPATTAAINGVLSQYGLTLTPEFDLSAADMDALVAEAEERSGEQQMDWRGMYRVGFAVTSPTLRQQAVDALLALPSVEYAAVNRIDLPPPTATLDYTPLQTYRGSLPGINAEYAEGLGLRGEGMKYVDIEFCWLRNHEDLRGPLGSIIQAEADVQPSITDFGVCSHGAATVGIISSRDNGFGMRGLATEATVMSNPERTDAGPRRPSAIASAGRRTAVGDLIMLEMQESGLDGPFDYVPAEFNQAVYDAVRLAIGGGRVVVAAAGNGFSNGGQNLDSEIYADYRDAIDSGAIIVGAGSADGQEVLPVSAYGSRVNLQGWGQFVATLGFGSLILVDNDTDRSYTDVFDGTSSATAMVAGAAILAQQAVKLEFGGPFDAYEMRELLRRTGSPQGPVKGDRHIGPLPNLQGVIERINEADAGLTAAQASQRFKLLVNNLGPSRVAGRTMTVTAFSTLGNQLGAMNANAEHCVAQPNPLNLTCQQRCDYAIQGQGCGLSKVKSCLLVTCPVPQVRSAKPLKAPPQRLPVALEWACAGGTLVASAVISAGDQVDPNQANNSTSFYKHDCN